MAAGEPTASGEDMIRERMWVERPAGTHLGKASDGDGYSPLARDDESNAIDTHVRLHPDDEADEADDSGGLPDLRTVAIGGLAVVGAVVIVKKLAPPAQRFLRERAMPALRSAWGTLTRTGGDNSEERPDEPATVVVASTAVVADDRTAMSAAEARERFAAALIARAFSDEQLNVLRGARIVDGPETVELGRALEELTPEQLESGVRLLLENGSPEELRQLLGFSGPEGEPLPLRLTDGES